MPHLIDDADWPDFKALMADYRSGRLFQTGRAGRGLPDARPNIVAILLEDLESGGDATAAVIRRETVNEVQRVDLVGTVTGGTFKLSFQGEATEDIAHDASAEDMREALEALPSINAGDVAVVAYSGRWLIQFTGQYGGTDVELVAVEENALEGAYNVVRISSALQWVDANRTESIHGQLPVGTPTPLKSGAVVSAGWFPEAASYCILNVECRDLDTADDYGSYA